VVPINVSDDDDDDVSELSDVVVVILGPDSQKLSFMIINICHKRLVTMTIVTIWVL